MKATEIFTPGSFPQHTYVERAGDRLEQNLRDAIATPGQIVSLIGPSKSGKTVLVEKVVGKDSLITVTGAGVQSPEDIWQRVLDWMGVPASETQATTKGGSLGLGGKVSGSASVLVAKTSGEVKGEAELTYERERSKTTGRMGLPQVVKEIADSDFVVLIDDFHYMPREVQAETAKSLKEAVRLGVKVCTASVAHRGDDLVRANPELRGRVRAIDLKYWTSPDLRKIAQTGFPLLNGRIDEETALRFVKESAGSPQLMQLVCLHACFFRDLRIKGTDTVPIDLSGPELQAVFEQASAATDFRSLVDVLEQGPPTRGTERKLYRFHDGTDGDVYRCVLKAVADSPPRLSFGYDELLQRTVDVCTESSPVGSSVASTCLQLARLALERFPKERTIDWDEEKQRLDVPDPYLLFYLRWSRRLEEME